MKPEHDVKLDKLKGVTIRWMCRLTLKGRKKNAELREVQGLDLVRMAAKKGRLRQFGHVEY